MSVDLSAARGAAIAWWNTVVMPDASIMQVVFEDEADGAKMVNPAAKVITRLKFIGIRPIGFDELRKPLISPANILYTPTVCGVRVVTLQCLVDSQTQAIDKVAINIAEQARTRLRLPVVRDALKAAGMALVEVTPSVEVQTPFDDRVFGRASFDAMFGMTAEITDPANLGDTIGSVKIDSDKINDVDGLPTDNQVDLLVTE